MIEIASMQALAGCYQEDAPTPAYTDSKGALANMTRMLAPDWALHGIDVNAIALSISRSG